MPNVWDQIAASQPKKTAAPNIPDPSPAASNTNTGRSFDVYDQIAAETQSAKPSFDVYDQVAATTAPASGDSWSAPLPADSWSTPLPAPSPLQAQTPIMDKAPEPVRARVEYNTSAGLNNAKNLAWNAWQDAGDLTQGMTAMGSEFIKRANQSVIDPLFQNKPAVPLIRTENNRKLWESSAQPGTPSDEGMAKQMLGGMATDMYNTYVAPGFEAAMLYKGGAPDAAKQTLGRYGKQAFEHPLQTVLDVPIIPAVKGTGALVKQGANAAMKVPAVARAAEGMSTAANMVPAIRNARGFNAINKAFINADRNFAQQMRVISSELDDLHRAVPDELKPHLMPAGHVSDDLSRALVDQSPEAQAFLQKVSERSQQITQEAINRGLMTTEEAEKALYEPYALALKSQGQLNQAAPLARDLTRQDILAAKAILDQHGIEPTYFGLIYKSDVYKPTQTIRTSFAKSIGNSNSSMSKRPGFMQPREKASYRVTDDGIGTITDAGQSLDALAVAKKRISEGLRFFQMQDAIEQTLANPAIAAMRPGKNMVPFNGENFLRQAARQAGFGAKEAEALVAGLPATAKAIPLPAASARWLKTLVKAQDVITDAAKSMVDNPIYKWGYQKPAQIYRRALLGYDVIGWPAIQWAQGGIMYGAHAFEGPHRVLASLMALGMSIIPKYRDIVPKELLADYKAMIEMTEPARGVAGQAWDSVKQAINAVPDRVTYPLVNAADNHWRIAGALYEALKRGKGVSPAALAKAISESHGDVSEAVFNHYGDYRPTGSAGERLLNDTVMFSPWLVNAPRIASTLVTQHPFKTAALSEAAQVAPSVLQNQAITPEHMYAGGAVPFGPNDKDPNGDQLFSWKPGVVPFTQPIQTVQQIANKLVPIPGADPTRGLSLHPYLQPQPDGANPNLVPYGQGFVSREDLEKSLQAGEPVPSERIIKQWWAEPATAFGQRFFPRQTSQILQAKEYPFAPSGGSQVLGAAAPQRVGQGEKRVALNGDQVLRAILEQGVLYGRFSPTPAKFEKGEEDIMKRMQWIKAVQSDRIRNMNNAELAREVSKDAEEDDRGNGQ